MSREDAKKFVPKSTADLGSGVQPDYIYYMMGHTISTYNCIASKGIESLRNIYTSTGLSINPRSQASKTEIVKEFIRGLGMNPDGGGYQIEKYGSPLFRGLHALFIDRIL